MLGEPEVPVNSKPENEVHTNEDLLGTSSGSSSHQPPPTNINLNVNEFQTESDMKQYDDRNVIDKLTDLTDFRDFMKK